MTLSDGRRAALFAVMLLTATAPACSRRKPEPLREGGAASASSPSPSLERALEALDAGDLAAAEELLVALPRERAAVGAILDAVKGARGKGGPTTSLLANVRRTSSRVRRSMRLPGMDLQGPRSRRASRRARRSTERQRRTHSRSSAIRSTPCAAHVEWPKTSMRV